MRNRIAKHMPVISPNSDPAAERERFDRWTRDTLLAHGNRLDLLETILGAIGLISGYTTDKTNICGAEICPESSPSTCASHQRCTVDLLLRHAFTLLAQQNKPSN